MLKQMDIIAFNYEFEVTAQKNTIMIERVKPVNYRNIALVGRLSVDNRRRSSEKVSTTHDEGHLEAVANLTQLVGKIYEFNERENELSYATGWFHDFKRQASEDPKLNEEIASANAAMTALIEMNSRGIWKTNEEERKAIYYSIANHSSYPEWMSQRDPETLAEKLHIALFVADKLEANGVKVLARRSAFVGKERLEGGDLKEYGFQKGFTNDSREVEVKDELLVVAIETLFRIACINPKRIYPKKLQSLVEPLYEVQYEFLNGILGYLNMSVLDVAKEIFERRRPEDNKNLVEVQQKKLKLAVLPENPLELVNIFVESSGITLSVATQDLANSAFETVRDFSFTENAELLMFNWSPINSKAQEWAQGMKDYASGKWFNQMMQGYSS